MTNSTKSASASALAAVSPAAAALAAVLEGFGLRDLPPEGDSGSPLPWGPLAGSHGRVFIQHRADWVGEPARWRVCLDRAEVWAENEGWKDLEQARRALAEGRRLRRAVQDRHSRLVRETQLAVARGARPLHCRGQNGGMLLAPSGEWVSAWGVSRAWGVDRGDWAGLEAFLEALRLGRLGWDDPPTL